MIIVHYKMERCRKKWSWPIFNVPVGTGSNTESTVQEIVLLAERFRIKCGSVSTRPIALL